MFGTAKCEEPIENDHAIQAVGKIFNVYFNYQTQGPS
jgi:hypothetical protein